MSLNTQNPSSAASSLARTLGERETERGRPRERAREPRHRVFLCFKRFLAPKPRVIDMGSTGLRLNSDAGYVNVQSRNVTGDALDPQWKVPNKALSLSLSLSLSLARAGLNGERPTLLLACTSLNLNSN
jgi:hypothetical protein